MKNIRVFLTKNVQFLELKFSIYLYRRVFVMCFLSSVDLSGISTECQTFQIQIRPNFFSGLIWLQTACKGYQLTTKVTTSGESVNA